MLKTAAHLAFTALLLAAIPSGDALPSRPYRARSRAAAAAAAGGHGGRASKSSGLTRWVTQWVDHMDGGSTNMFKQRYFLNSTLFDNTTKTPLVFLCVGGEGPPYEEDVVVTGQNHCALMVKLAAIHGGLILALEHRYYGESIPTDDLSTPSLRFLSAEQALMDMATFHEHITATMDLPKHTRWIVFGGSYPGMLAAWSRQRFPHLFYAAVSSSAPLNAVPNMFQYNDVVGHSLGRKDVGGSLACLGRVRAAFEEMGDMMTTKSGREKLVGKLGVCGDSDALEDKGNMNVASMAASEVFEVQSNDPACEERACNIQKQCEIMLGNASETPLESLAVLNKISRGGGCIESDFSALVGDLTNVTKDGGGDRVWFYQTCTEFGFFQTCDPGTECPFMQVPHLNDLQSYYDLCEAAFGVTREMTEQRIRDTDEAFGGLGIKASRILFVNGDIDPWSALSLLKPHKGMPAFVVKGASHHFWTHPEKPTDSPAVVAARRAIIKGVTAWLATGEVGTGEGGEEIAHSIQ